MNGLDSYKKSKWFTRSLWGLLAVLLISPMTWLGVRMAGGAGVEKKPPVVEVVEKPADAGAADQELAKSDLAGLIGSRSLDPGEHILAVTDAQGRTLFIRPTVLPDLQDRAARLVKGSKALQAALVVLEPQTGEVLALAGHRSDGEEANAALAGSFPAASLFKIITAAAAVESAALSADSSLAYDGGKHTLYKNNVNQEPTKGRNATTLKESFADSINSVFGKLGAFTLGPVELAAFAGRFGFNHNIDFEMPVEVSSFSVDNEDDPFHLAELASGFNRSTKVSPLHGALIAAAVVSGGNLPDPVIVKQVFDIDNHIYYEARPGEQHEIISPATAAELSRLMRSAVTEGTGRRTFSDAPKHPVLSRLLIGGKSGSINNEQGDRVDWFVAWAEPKDSKDAAGKLALSAVVVHNGQALTTSQKLVREALITYYRDRLGQPARSAAK
ncbi:hypothetical protein LJB86_04115 [Deltaproteobacteria bacterium OttesenSCG-928-M10]|nr:hypothetical protein [Deltaproteobacteria bacterium OttesenSCG-928-M10]